MIPGNSFIISNVTPCRCFGCYETRIPSPFWEYSLFQKVFLILSCFVNIIPENHMSDVYMTQIWNVISLLIIIPPHPRGLSDRLIFQFIFLPTFTAFYRPVSIFSGSSLTCSHFKDFVLLNSACKSSPIYLIMLHVID